MATQEIVAEAQTLTLTTEQHARIAAFEQKERELAAEIARGAVLASPVVSGSSTTTYSVTMSDTGDGVAFLSWSVSRSLGQEVIGLYEWVGVFANKNQALSNPVANYLGGLTGWQYARSGSRSYKTTVKLQPGQVAAYVIKDWNNQYVTVAVTSPYPLDV
jgi:hypothetical protein